MWSDELVGRVADVLGHTDTGLTGTEIGQLLASTRVADVAPSFAKRHRLRGALLAWQRADGAPNCIIAFIRAATSPVRYTDHPAEFPVLAMSSTRRPSTRAHCARSRMTSCSS